MKKEETHPTITTKQKQRHCCLWQCTPILGWGTKVKSDPLETLCNPETYRVLQQRWQCDSCGKTKWRDIKEIKE